MTIERKPLPQYPQVELGRRIAAFSIDFFVVWVISSLAGSSGIGIQVMQILVFAIAWVLLRVVVVYNNQGQSLGRYALDMKILEVGRGRVPDLQTLLQRESIVGLEALLLGITLSNIIRNPTAILLVLPLVIDCGRAASDTQLRQTWHDRYARTIIASSRRGYSLDIKVKRFLATMRRNVRR